MATTNSSIGMVGQSAGVSSVVPVSGANSSSALYGSVVAPQTAQDPGQLKSHIDAALKNSGIKAEIKDVTGGAVVVQLLDAESGKLIIQLPSQTVLDLVSGMEKQISKESQPSGPILPTSGTMINQLA